MATIALPIEDQGREIDSTRIRPLFKPVLDRINLVLPLIFIPLVFWCLSIGWKPNVSESEMLLFATNFIFMDITHTGFTIVLFLCLPEVRQFLNTSIQERRLWVFLGAGLFLVLPVFLAGQWSGQLELDPHLAQIANWILMALWLQHAVAQVFGISLIYNRQFGIDAWAAMWERRLFKILIYQSIASPVVRALAPDWFLLIFYLLIPPIVIFFILLLAFRQSESYPSHKFVFQLRLILFLMSPLHPLAMTGVMAFHAFEYLCVSDRMVGNSKVGKGLWSIAAILSLAFVIYPLIRWQALDYTFAHVWHLVLIAAFCRTFDFFHYFVDGILFRFKDQGARQYIGPLLEKP